MRNALRVIWSDRPSRAVALVFAFISTLFGTWLARIPEAQNALGLSEAELGWALLGAPVGMLGVMPVAGWLIARWGAGRVTVAAALACAIVFSGPGWATSGWTLALALGTIGVADGTLNVAMNARANVVEERRGTPILSTCHGFFSVGGMLGAGLGSVTAALDVPLPWTLVGVGLVGGAVVFAHRDGLTSGRRTASVGPVFALPTKALAGLALLAFCVLLSEGAVSNWSAVYLRNGLGASAAVAGLGYACFSLTMALGRFYGDRAVSRFGAQTVVQGGAAAASVGLVTAILVAHPVAGVLGFAVMGLGYAALVPVLFRAASRTPGLAPGTSLAAVASAGYLGLFLGPPALGGVAEAWGLAWTVGIVAALSAFVAVGAGRVLQPTPATARS